MSLASLSVLLALATSTAWAKPTPERFPDAQLPDVTRTQGKLGASSGVVARPTIESVIANPAGILVGGKTLVTITNGATAPGDSEGDTIGRTLPRLTTALGSAVALALGIDRSLRFQILLEILGSARVVGAKVQLLVHAGGAVAAIPFDAVAKSTDDGLGMVIALSNEKLVVLSRSGHEGSLAKPLATIEIKATKGELAYSDAATQLRTVLEGVVKRWRVKRKRAPFGKTITLLPAPDTSIQLLADVMVAARPQFPTVNVWIGPTP